MVGSPENGAKANVVKYEEEEVVFLLMFEVTVVAEGLGFEATGPNRGPLLETLT